MGEIAEMMLDGTLCQCCGEYLGSDEGYPMYCAGCRPKKPAAAKQKVYRIGVSVVKVPCPTCGKRVSNEPQALGQHHRAAHRCPPPESVK